MNHRMWIHPATRANVALLRARGVSVMEPGVGAMACGEFGPGRLPEPPAILEAARAMLRAGPLHGLHALVTAGPTHEAIDPVRYIANRSSGRQGFAVASALAALGARVTLVAGPVSLPTPPGVDRIDVTTAREMHAAALAALPADLAVMVAAVADWGVEAPALAKLKKDQGPPAPRFTANPDILAEIAALPPPKRPRLVIGFAAETEEVDARAAAKRRWKGADWVIGNDVSGDVMGGPDNAVVLATPEGVEHWPVLPKEEVARRLAGRVVAALQPAAINPLEGFDAPVGAG